MALGIGALFRVCTRVWIGQCPNTPLIGDVSVVSKGHRGLAIVVLVPSAMTLFLMLIMNWGPPVWSPWAVAVTFICTGLGLRSAMAGKGNAWASSIWAVQVRRASLVGPWRLALTGAVGAGRHCFRRWPLLLFSRGPQCGDGLVILYSPTAHRGGTLSACFGLSLSNTAEVLGAKSVRQLTGRAQVRSWSGLVNDSGADNGPLELSLSTGIKVVITPPHSEIKRHLETMTSTEAKRAEP